MGHLPIRLQVRFEGQFGSLEFQERFLHADGGQQHVVRRTSSATFPIGVQRGLVINRPCVLPSPCAGSKAGHHHIGRLVKRFGRNRCRIGDVTEAHHCTGEVGCHGVAGLLATDAAALTREGHHLVSALHEFLHDEAADVSGRTEDDHTNLFRWTVAEVSARGHGAESWTIGRN